MYAEPRPIRKLVYRLPTWVGDAVMATPALRALRRRYPEATLMACGRRPLLELLDGSDLFDDGVETAEGAGRMRTNARRLRQLGADAAVIFPHSFRTAWETFRAGIPVRVGYAREGRRFLLTHTLPPHRTAGRILPVPMPLQYLELVAVLGARGDDSGPRLACAKSLRSKAERTLRELGFPEGRRVVALNPGASFGPSKIWPVEFCARAADAFQRDGDTRVLILCGPGEEDLAREIEDRMEVKPLTTRHAPPPLEELKVILERVALLVTTDAGPRHIATAMGTPTVVLMGPTDPRYSDSGDPDAIVLRRDVECAPCHLKVCPIDHRCMTRIPPEEVVAVGRTLLDRRDRREPSKS